MKNHQEQENGFSLLELLLVIAVTAAILLASYQRYKQYILNKDLAAIRQNAALLMQSLNEYYAHLITNCSTPTKHNCPTHEQRAIITSNQDLPEQYWPQYLISSNLVADKNLNRDSHDYVVSTSLGIPTTPPKMDPDAKWTHQLIVTVTLDPHIVATKGFEWYAKILEAFLTENNKLRWKKMPSYTTKGLNSNLWIMDGELAVFKKALTGTA